MVVARFAAVKMDLQEVLHGLATVQDQFAQIQRVQDSHQERLQRYRIPSPVYTIWCILAWMDSIIQYKATKEEMDGQVNELLCLYNQIKLLKDLVEWLDLIQNKEMDLKDLVRINQLVRENPVVQALNRVDLERVNATWMKGVLDRLFLSSDIKTSLVPLIELNGPSLDWLGLLERHCKKSLMEWMYPAPPLMGDLDADVLWRFLSAWMADLGRCVIKVGATRDNRTTAKNDRFYFHVHNTSGFG